MASSTPNAAFAAPARPEPPRRHPLGLPAGSVRAILVLIVLGLIWAIVIVQQTRDIEPPPIYLYFLMFLMLGHFFAAHGKSIAGAQSPEASPLYLPRGVIRTILFLGFVGVFAWRYYKDQNLQQFLDMKPAILDQAYLPFALIGAFLLGILVARVANLGRISGTYWFQDLLAWISLLAVLGLCAEVIILIIINPSLAPDRQIKLPNFQMALAGVISFYFGVRS